MRVRVLGRCEVEGVGLRFRQAELVGLLAMRQGPLSRATIAETLWPEVETSTARHNLRQTLVALRASVGAPCVQAEGETLALMDAEVDLWEVQARLGGDFAPEDIEELLPDVRGEWVFPARESFVRTIVAAALRQGENRLADDPMGTLAYAGMALAQDPWLEASRSLRVRALLALGARASAEREILSFETETGLSSRLRSLLAPAEGDPLSGVSLGSLSPNERVRLLTAAAPGLPNRVALAAALEAAPSLSSDDRARGEAALASLALEDGDMAFAEATALAASGRAKVPTATLALIRIFIRTDRLAEAESLLSEADRVDDIELRAAFEAARGAALQRRHLLPEAERALRRALEIAERAGSARLVAKARHGLASVALWSGRPEAAAREIEAGLRACSALPVEKTLLEMTLGRIRESEGRWNEAQSSYAHAVEAARAAHDPWTLAEGLTYLADLTRRRGARDDAVVAYREAVTLRRGIGDRLGLATALKGLGQALGDEGEVALRESLEAYLASGEPLGGAAAHLPLARLLRDLGRGDEALIHARRAAERLVRMRAESLGLATDDTLSPDAALALVAELEGKR